MLSQVAIVQSFHRIRMIVPSRRWHGYFFPAKTIHNKMFASQRISWDRIAILSQSKRTRIEILSHEMPRQRIDGRTNVMSIYREWGLEPIINVSGAVTRLGGAPMPKAVLEAFCAAAEESIPLDELQGAASRVIAEATGAEAGIVTSGAAAG